MNTGGTLGGDGKILGNVTLDGGTLSAGTSPGNLTIDGNLTLNSGVTLIEFSSSSLFDTISGINSMSYGGELRFVIADGVAAGTYQIFDFTSRVGVSEFSDIIFSPDYTGTFDYGTGELTLIAVPEPTVASFVGLTLALGGAAILRRKRRALV